MRVIVTTPRHGGEAWIGEARVLAEAVGGVFVPRGERSIADLSRSGEPVVVIGPSGMAIHTDAGVLRYHPGMGRPRVVRLKRGGRDTMIDAMALRPGDHVLDCTLGLASDALVASYWVGEQGRVEGWESVPVLAELVRRGLATYRDDDPDVTAALRRIEVYCRDHRLALRELPDRSFDVVYFDPMFREPVWESAHFRPLRTLTDERPLSLESVREARRVARRRVVIKERRGSPIFEELGVDEVAGGRNSRIAYGIIHTVDCSGRDKDAYG